MTFSILLVLSPQIIEFLTPYKEVGSDYFSNPVPGEKVKFTGEYIGTTSNNVGFLYYNIYSYEYDIVKIGGYYIFIQGSPDVHKLYNYKGHTVYIEGRFASTEKSTEPTENGDISGYWFGADKIEIID